MFGIRVISTLRIVGLLLAACFIVTGCGLRSDAPVQAAAAAVLGPDDATDAPRSFGAAGRAAVSTLEREFYHAPGRWNACVPGDCGTVARDWGADALAYALFLHWRISGDPGVLPIMHALSESLPMYHPCSHGTCSMWSDVPLWDAVADARVFEVTRRPLALEKAKRAFALVDESHAFASGACPAIDFQRTDGAPNALKTLETDANYIKAALLLERFTGESRYLAKARAKYGAVRHYFLDRKVALYSVYVFDNGVTCTQLSKRFFASVNGTMIDNGLALAARTSDHAYRRDAIATARAVTRYLSDPSGVYANLQADNDIAQPLVEAMYDIATQEHQAFARRWLIAAAAVARPAPSGAYGRFFDGPPPDGPVSVWSTNGGLTLAIAAGALDPHARIGTSDGWAGSRFIADPIASTSAQIEFTGRAIALIGTIGDVCCEAGHARVFIDGNETYNNTGIWQNKSSASRQLPNSILLSWRWPHPGRHTIAFAPGIPNAKEGGSFIHLAGYKFVP